MICSSTALLFLLVSGSSALLTSKFRLQRGPRCPSQLSDSSSDGSRYVETSSAAKAVVSGLTSLLNVLFPQPMTQPRIYKKDRIRGSEIVDGIYEDFRRGYLFSGDIQAEIYSEDCVFTDPTLSFKGLSTFERNIASIKPALDAFLGDNACILYSLSQDKENRQIYTKWRMIGDIKLLPFWTPRLDLGGQTTFTYERNGGGRINDYYEKWDISAGDALLQLLGRSSLQSVHEIAKEETATAKVVNYFSDTAKTRTLLRVGQRRRN